MIRVAFMFVATPLKFMVPMKESRCDAVEAQRLNVDSWRPPPTEFMRVLIESAGIFPWRFLSA
jgi:hypothetical protein